MKNKAGVAVRIVVNGRRLVYLSVFPGAAPGTVRDDERGLRRRVSHDAVTAARSANLTTERPWRNLKGDKGCW